MFADQGGDLVEVVLGSVELADQHFELAKTVEQGGQLPLLVAGHVAVALDKVLDLLALAVAADGQAVARLDLDVVQAVAVLQRNDPLVEVAE